MHFDDYPTRPSRAGNESLDEIRERVSRGLIVTDEDDPVEAFAKERISRMLRKRRVAATQASKTIAGAPLFTRLQSEPAEVLTSWTRDDLYKRRRR